MEIDIAVLMDCLRSASKKYVPLKILKFKGPKKRASQKLTLKLCPKSKINILYVVISQ